MGLILVDSSVWIDWITERDTIQARALTKALDDDKSLAIGDLVLAEVLQGARSEHAAEEARQLLSEFVPVVVSGHQVAIEAARNYRLLRSKGIAVRKTIDTLIATRCILDGLPLLYSDRDFDPFVAHCGLRSALDLLSGAK